MTATLALVTCGPQLEVGLVAPGMAVPSIVRLAGMSPRSTLVLAAADLLLEDAGLAPADLTRVAVSRGPGSFTGIRSGIATASGLAAASDVMVMAFGSLLVQAARCDGSDRVWAAQPGRRGEVYAQAFDVSPSLLRVAVGPVEVVAVADAPGHGPWIAAERLDLGGAPRIRADRSAAEALLRLVDLGAPPEVLEPVYIEGPPIHGLEGGA